MRVLLVEDHDRLARAVAAGLRRRGMSVDVSLDGDEALDRLAVSQYDVVVLDRDLPGVHGDDICRTLVANRSASRVLMLTAARSVKDRVDGLGLGADDYLPKPFDFAELVARIRALGRRPGAPQPAIFERGDLSLVLAANAEQERLIEALLTLAEGESGLGRREPVDLSDLASEALLAQRPEIGQLGLRIRAATEPASLDGDPLLVERLVANLLDNAVRHNLPGGRVEIATATKHSRAVLSVTNTGPVIPSTEVGRLFQPFQRLNGRNGHRGGHGLGLSIVQAIATAHGATVTAHAPRGGGLAIDVAFPPAGRL